MFGFEYRLILSMFYVWFRVSFDTQYVLCVVSRYRSILDMFYLTFQGCRLGVFIVTVYKAPDSLTSVFKVLLFSGLRESRLRQTEFQYTWLNSHFFSSLQESRPNILSIKELLGSCDIVRSLLQQLSLSLRYLVSLHTALWYRAIVSLTYRFPPSPREAVTPCQKGLMSGLSSK